MTAGRQAFLFILLFIPAFVCFPEGRTVSIKSARSTEYVKDDGSRTDEKTEIIRFSGDVLISVSEGSSVSNIGADEIVYNKTRDTLEARGNVTYEHTSGKSGSEKFSGEALLFNIQKQEGVFLEGAVSQDSGKKDSDPFIVHAEVTGRDSGATMAFKKGVLTTCDAEDPHWSINASRIWLLPGNEIAILNGVFFIGPLPVFYIPFFYYPADEMIFHPVFGYRNREGYFVQTTTYLYGRKPLDTVKAGEESSFATFLQGDTLKEQERHGLFLKNLKEDAKDADPDYFKILLDGYSSLGAMVGVQGSFTSQGYVKSVSFSTLLGFSRTLYAPSSGFIYSTYDSEGNRNSNPSWLFGYKMPFRYRSDFSLNVDKKPFNLTVAMPLISDQEFKDDFTDRSETLNWFKLLTEQDELSEGSEISDETTYSWNLNGSVTPDVSFAGHWLTTASITSLTGNVTFNSKANETYSDEELLYAPGKTFFFPEIIKPSMKLSFGGTLLSSDETKMKKANASEESKVDTGGIENPFDAPDQSAAADPAEKKRDRDRVSLFIPAGGTGLVPTPKIADADYGLTWAFKPSLLFENRYDKSEWKTPEDIQWNDFSSQYYQFESTTSLIETYAFDVDFFTVRSSLDFTNKEQKHTKLSGTSYDTESEVHAAQLADYRASVYSLSTTEGVALKPFNRNAFLKPMSVSWNFTGDVLRNYFDGTVHDAKWAQEWFEWDKDFIDTHAATTVIGIAPGNYEQKLSFTSNLPPLLASYTGVANFAWKFGTLTMNTRLYEKSEEDKKWVWDPYKTVVSWSFPLGIKLGQEFIYDIEETEPSRLHFTGGVGSFSLFYTLTNTIPYKLTAGTGWELDGTEKEFIPSAMGCTFNNTSKPLKLYSWKNRFFLQAAVDTNLKIDLLKVTESSFDFKPSLTLKVHEFLDVVFSSTSRNEVIARYFQQWVDLPEELPGERNALVDLGKSFNLFNTRDRTQSGFKLKALSFGLVHYLHDWTMSYDTSIEPELKYTDGKYRYEFVPTIKLMVSWKPVSDIKTTVRSEEGVFSLNTTDDDDDD
jgi:lipopolysaccharide assembly outer membrane protein LptD (OstA)